MNGRLTPRLNANEVESPFVSFTELLTSIFIIMIAIIAVFSLSLGSKKQCEWDDDEFLIVDEDTAMIAGFNDSLNDRGLEAFYDCKSQSVVLPESVLFDIGSSEIKTLSQQRAVRNLALILGNLLVCEVGSEGCKRSENFDTVLIEGHADTLGPADYNLKLSQDRSSNVYKEILSVLQNREPFKRLQITPENQWLGVSAYGETRLRVPTADDVAESQNRRIEIRFIFRD